MATTDAFGQNISIAALTDAPNANTLAFNIVDALAGRGVMRFASASERNATLTSPVAGMMAWIGTEKLLTHYDGTAWVVVSAGTQAWTTVGLASGFAHDGNSNGTFQYRVVNEYGEKSIKFRGGISVTYSGTNIPNSGVLNTTALPSAARPTTRRTISVPCSDVSSVRITLKMDIQTDGFLKVFGTGTGSDGTTTPPWIGFNGCYSSL